MQQCVSCSLAPPCSPAFVNASCHLPDTTVKTDPFFLFFFFSNEGRGASSPPRAQDTREAGVLNCRAFFKTPALGGDIILFQFMLKKLKCSARASSFRYLRNPCSAFLWFSGGVSGSWQVWKHFHNFHSSNTSWDAVHLSVRFQHFLHLLLPLQQPSSTRGAGP